MNKYEEYLLDEECELIDQKLIEEGFLDFFKKKNKPAPAPAPAQNKPTPAQTKDKGALYTTEKSPIAKIYKSSRERLDLLGDLLKNGKYEETLEIFAPLMQNIKSLEGHLNELVKGQKKVKMLQRKNERINDAKARIERENESESESGNDSRGIEDESGFSVKTESCFNY